MKGMDLTERMERLRAGLGKYRYVLLVILAGIILLLLPGGNDRKSAAGDTVGSMGQSDLTDSHALEEKLEQALSRVSGAGEVDVVLSIETGTRQIWARDGKREEGTDAQKEEQTTVVVSRGSGLEEAVPVQQISPQFRGALVVCSGGDDPSVRLALMEAVSALTGLGSDKISICKGK